MIATHAALAPASDEGALKRAYSCFPSGVVAVCCHRGAPESSESHESSEPTDSAGPELVGMAASAFTSVSLDPPLVSVCVQNTSTTWPRLRDAGTVGVSVFAHDQAQLCRQLAGPAPRRFDGIEPLGSDDGALFIPGAAAHLSCTIESEIPAGDHLLVLLRIRRLDADPEVEPLVFHASTFRALQARIPDDDPTRR
ncbi:flavin reductase family protein [Gordonia polyisoprenivorans]|uniref:flavin reductase family protein n=1 Tax=Gordonia polyisoprenivorans TaxID=84595 RepID=UPI001AD6B21E|nr:flavin reductase family protein [Gordonia polyisoprenivorans]QTI71886.1 flavin reductase family protein [Gordonia polyisoprenivorans]